MSLDNDQNGLEEIIDGIVIRENWSGDIRSREGFDKILSRRKIVHRGTRPQIIKKWRGEKERIHEGKIW